MSIFRDRPDLLPPFREGERLALDLVYRVYVCRVTATVEQALRWRVKRVGVTRAQIADCVQEVFARAFSARARAAFDGQREFGPYLGALAHNVAVDWRRRHHREIVTDWSEIERLLHATNPCLEEEPLTAGLGPVIAGYLSSLPAPLRALHEARYEDGLSQQQAASRLGLSRQNVRTLEARLHAGLRRRIGRTPPQPARAQAARA
jgi:RNA polymerase sigma factor (sigma-70 family)